MDIESTQKLNEAAPLAIAELKHFLQTETTDGNNNLKKIDVALTLLGRINSNDAIRIKGLALQFQIARSMGIKGEPLRPLLAELNPGFVKVDKQLESSATE
jgi:hypothetical protein